MIKLKQLYKNFKYVWNERRYDQFKNRYERERGGTIMVDIKPDESGVKNLYPVRDERLGVDKGRSFKTRCFRKFVENVLSVKVWVIFSVMTLSSVFLCVGLLSGEVFAALNGGTISTIFALRESFKIARIHTPDEIIGEDKDLFV